ncbi:MAG: hypothetical protein IJ367_02885 [Clostridia bacterium]|nr:hypothetical protein [Clostridia bacterium]
MNKYQLKKNVDKTVTETKEAISTMYDALNQGQKKKIMKNEKVKDLMERHGVNADV